MRLYFFYRTPCSRESWRPTIIDHLQSLRTIAMAMVYCPIRKLLLELFLRMGLLLEIILVTDYAEITLNHLKIILSIGFQVCEWRVIGVLIWLLCTFFHCS